MTKKISVLVFSISLLSIIMTGAVITVLANSQGPVSTFVTEFNTSGYGNIIDEKVSDLKEVLRNKEHSDKGNGSTETSYVYADYGVYDNVEESKLKELLIKNRKNVK